MARVTMQVRNLSLEPLDFILRLFLLQKIDWSIWELMDDWKVKTLNEVEGF